MPIREFRCQKCGKVFEFLVLKESDARQAACPECGSKRLEKLFSVFGLSGCSKESSGSGGCSTCSGGTCSVCGD